jgi:hypothetical protein
MPGGVFNNITDIKDCCFVKRGDIIGQIIYRIYSINKEKGYQHH